VQQRLGASHRHCRFSELAWAVNVYVAETLV